MEKSGPQLQGIMRHAKKLKVILYLTMKKDILKHFVPTLKALQDGKLIVPSLLTLIEMSLQHTWKLKTVFAAGDTSMIGNEHLFPHTSLFLKNSKLQDKDTSNIFWG